jgi:protein-S-isoprenylcysteine O-methyltransferase Ste14
MPIGRDGKSEIAERLRETAEDLMELVAAQVKLMRIELHGDARNLGARLVRVAVFLPLLCIGYAFTMGALAYALGTQIGFAWAFALLGVVHAAVGGWGLAIATRTLRQIRVLDRSREELERSLKTVTPAAIAPAVTVNRT